MITNTANNVCGHFMTQKIQKSNNMNTVKVLGLLAQITYEFREYTPPEVKSSEINAEVGRATEALHKLQGLYEGVAMPRPNFPAGTPAAQATNNLADMARGNVDQMAPEQIHVCNMPSKREMQQKRYNDLVEWLNLIESRKEKPPVEFLAEYNELKKLFGPKPEDFQPAPAEVTQLYFDMTTHQAVVTAAKDQIAALTLRQDAVVHEAAYHAHEFESLTKLTERRKELLADKNKEGAEITHQISELKKFLSSSGNE